MLTIGVDPSVRSSGWAVLKCDGSIESGVVALAEVGVLLNDFMEYESSEKVELCIESPHSNKGFRKHRGAFSLKSVQAARNQWELAVRKRWARKNKIHRVTPMEWRKNILHGHPMLNVDPKIAACETAGVDDHNEAEARLILEYWTALRKM